MYPNIRVRITMPFLLVVVIIAAIGAFIVTRLVAGNIQERLSNQLASSAQAAVSTVADVERQQLSTLRLMVFTDGLSSAIIEDDTEAINTLLIPVASNAGISDAYVFDIGGNPVTRISRIITPEGIIYQPNTNALTLPGVTRVTDGLVDQRGDKFVDLINQGQSTLLYISGPVIIDNGELVGGVSVGLDARDFSRRVSEQSLSSIILYDETGTVLGSTFRDATWQDLTLPADTTAAIIADTQEFSDIQRIEVENLDYQILYTPLQLRGEINGLIGVALPVDFVSDRIGTSRDSLVILFSSLFFAIAILGLGVARSIVQPVRQLVSTTRAIADGDLTRRVNLRLPDELGELGSSFDTMTEQLVEQNQQIRMLYNQQLQETARRQAILASVGDALVVMQANGEMLLANETAQDLLEDLYHHDDHAYDTVVDLFQKPEQSFTAQTLTLRGKHYSTVATPVYMEDDRSLLGYVIILRDITSLIEAERLKDEMILQISHELRTPLTVIKGYLDLTMAMRMNTMPDTEKSILKGAVESAGLLTRLVNEVIDVSAVLADKLDMRFENFNLGHLVYKVAQEHMEAIKEREIKLSLMIPNNTDVWVEGDPNHLRTVVIHILRNAYSYTLKGGWIEVTLEKQPNTVQVIIVDNGVGIGADEIERVFERMVRGRAADAGETDTRGLGFGLYIARYILGKHNGTITLDSQEDMGTIATITLPVRQEGNTPDES